MKRIIVILALILAPALLFAQTNAQQNEAGNTYLPANGNISQNIAVDRALRQIVTIASGTNGSQSVIPVSNATGLNGVGAVGVGYQFVGADAVEAASTTTVINATAHVARIGDVLSFRSGTAGNIGVWSTVSAITVNTITLANALLATPSAADAFYILRPQPLSVNPNNGNASVNALNVAVSLEGQVSNSLSLLKLEDAAHTTGDAGVFSLGVSNLDLGGALCSGSGDYCPIATNINGAVYTNLALSNNAISPVRSEDAVHASGDALINIGGVLRSALSAVAAVGDYSNIQLDESGRLITTSAPSAELLQGCNTAITTSTTGTIINATASKFNYITGFTCTNTGATGTRIIIEDGDGVDMANAFVVGLTGYATATFPGAGIKTNAVNKTIQVNVITAGSSTICCVSGHVGV